MQAQLNYTRTTFSGTYSSISGTVITGAQGDDVTGTAQPIGFSFTYNGTAYTTVNVCSNGWLNFATSSTSAANSGLGTTTNPNAALAPWWDDLSSSSVQYLTSGSAPNRVFTVQWVSLSYYQISTRTINYQVKLYETTNEIEFWYGSVSGTNANGNFNGATNGESASIGIKNQTGGPGNFIDAISGSSQIYNGTLNSGQWPTQNYRFTPGAPTALAGGTYNVGVGQTYTTLTEAVADINHKGISGAITLNLTDATYTDKTAGGAETFPIVFGTVAGTSAVNTITITGNGADLRYAGSAFGSWGNGSASGTMFGTAAEPILGVCGTDYLNINNIKLTALTGVVFGTSSGTPTRVERGLAVQNSGAINGATFNNFTGLTITLDRTNTSTMAIDQGNSTTPTSAAGANSNNVYKNLTIKNTQKGISLGGNASFPDLACEIGTTSCTTFNTIGDPATANDIGNTTTASYGIQATNQSGVKIYNNSVRNVTGSAVQVDGINLVSAQGTSEIYNNKVQTVKNSSTSSTTGISGIAASHTTTGTHVIRIYNNAVSEILTSFTGAATATRVARGIWIRGTGGATTQSYEVWNNSVSIDGTGNLNASNSCFEISTTSGPVFNVRNNIFANYTPAQGATAKHSGVYSTSATSLGNTGSTFQNNNIWIANDAGTSGFTANGNGTTYNGETAWQTAMAQATSNVNPGVNPVYVNTNSDLHATASGLNGAAQAPPGYITVDLDCATRTPDNDIGAYKIDGCLSANGGTASFTGGATSCAGLTKTMSSAGATAPAAGLTYQWEISSTGGGVGFANVSGGSGANTTSYTTGALTAGTYYYRLNVTCSSGPVTAYSNEITLTVNTAPTVTVSPTSASICSPGGTPATLTAGGAVSYAWSPTSGLTPISGSPVSANPASTTTYTVTGTDANGCTNTATSVITVASAIASTATATPSTICSGSTSTLAVSTVVTDPNAVIKITEVTLFRTGTGQTVTYPVYVAGADLVEISNISSSPVDISGWTLADYANGSTTASHAGFAFPASTIIPANSVAVVCLGAGTNDLANRYFNTGGSSDLWGSGSLVGIVLKNGSAVVDAVGLNSGYTFAAGTGVTAGDWSGFAPSASTFAGTIRSAASDSNTGADWIQSSAGTPQTQGTYNAGYTNPVGTLTYAWSPLAFIATAGNTASETTTALTGTQAYSVLVTTAAGCTATANTTVTVTPLSCSAATFSTPNCAGSNFTVTANTTGGGAPYNYVWSDGVGGIYPNAATITANLPAGTYNFTCAVTDGCGGSCNSDVTIVVNGLPTVTSTPSTGLICNPGGSAVTLTAGGAVSYTWSPTAGLTPTSGSPVSANPTSTTTYVVTGTDANGCTSTASSTITVAAAVTGATASASANPVCSGAPFDLTSSASQVNTIISQGFESGAAGWSFLDSSSTGTNLAQQLWHIQAAPYTDASGSATFSNFSITGNSFAYSNPDAGGSGSQTRTFMVSPSFSTVGYTGTGTLTFKQGYRYWSSSSPVEQVKVQITSNGGATWTDLVDYVTVTNTAIVGVTTNNAQTTASVSVTVPGTFMGQPSVQLRWRYLSNWGYYWVVDDIALTGNYTNLSYSWSSSPSGYTSGVQNPTGVTQIVNTDYSVLITGTGGCTATASTGVVSTNEAPTITCPGNQSANTSGACTAVVTYSESSTGIPAPAISYTFSGATTGSGSGNGSGSTFNVGVTTVQLTATNACGTVNCSFTVTVTDNENPVITCPANISVCDPGSPVVTFSVGATDNCGILSVVSTPPSGSTFAPGTTTVNSVATDVNGNTSNCSFTVTVSTPSTDPTSATSNDANNEICSGGSVDLTVNGGSLGTGANWVWYEGGCGSGSSVGSGSTITLTPTPGSHTYYVRAEGACNNTACVQITIFVSVPMTASVIVPPINNLPAYACNGTSTSNINVPSVANAYEYIWDAPTGTTFNGGANPYTASSPTANILFGSPGVGASGYYIGVQATNACGATLRKVQWVRNNVSVPATIIPANGRTTECANTNANYSIAAVGGATSYLWTITGDASIVGSGTSVTVNFGPAWTGGTLSVAAQTPCYTSPAKTLVLTNTAPVVGVMSGVFTACVGSTQTYSVPTAPGVASYTWTLPANTSGSSTTNSINVTFNAGFAGGNISVTATSICGVVTSPRTKSISVGTPGTPASITGFSNGTCNSAVSYSCPSQPGVTFTWSSNVGTVQSGQGTNSVSISFGTFTTGSVSVVASNACGSSAARTISVKGAPNTPGAISADPAVWCNNDAGITFSSSLTGLGGAYTLNWSILPAAAASIQSGQGTGSLLVDWNTGNATVSLTASNACGNGTRTFAATPSCRVAGSTIEEVAPVLQVYPNPASDKLSIAYVAEQAGDMSYQMIDVTGKVVINKALSVTEGANTHTIDISGFAKGIYMLHVTTSNKSENIRVVVQ